MYCFIFLSFLFFPLSLFSSLSPLFLPFCIYMSVRYYVSWHKINETDSLISMTSVFTGDGQERIKTEHLIQPKQIGVGGFLEKECLVWILKGKYEVWREERTSGNTGQGNSTWPRRTEGKGVWERILGSKRRLGGKGPHGHEVFWFHLKVPGNRGRS